METTTTAYQLILYFFRHAIDSVAPIDPRLTSTMLPAPGSPTFIPSLLAHLQSEISTGGEEWTIDPSLFSALLLSQIVGPGRGGVIVDVLPTESKRRGIDRVVESVKAVRVRLVSIIVCKS